MRATDRSKDSASQMTRQWWDGWEGHPHMIWEGPLMYKTLTNKDSKCTTPNPPNHLLYYPIYSKTRRDFATLSSTIWRKLFCHIFQYTRHKTKAEFSAKLNLENSLQLLQISFLWFKIKMWLFTYAGEKKQINITANKKNSTINCTASIY